VPNEDLTGWRAERYSVRMTEEILEEETIWVADIRQLEQGKTEYRLGLGAYWEYDDAVASVLDWFTVGGPLLGLTHDEAQAKFQGDWDEPEDGLAMVWLNPEADRPTYIAEISLLAIGQLRGLHDAY
jgi:hypothetical protein